MNKLALAVGVTAMLGAAGGCDDNRNVAVSNSNPLGVVGGRVLDLNGEAPLVGATVQLEEAGTTVMMTMTDATGTYSFAKVPAGSFFLTISAGGYETAYVPGTLSGSVGNFPVSNPQTTVPTVELFKTDGAFTVGLVDDRGAPVMGVAVTARPQVKYFAYNYPYNGGSGFPTLSPFGQYTVHASSDANGQATFMGLPNAIALNMISNFGNPQMYIDVPPITVMGSTTYQFLGFSYQVNPTMVSPPSGGNTFTIQLAGPSTFLTVVYSSVDYLVNKTGNVAPNFFPYPVGSLLPADKPLSITFNQAVDQKSLRAQLLTEDGTSLGNMTPTFAAGNIVSLAAMPAMMPGKRYNLVLHAEPLSLGGQSNSTPLNVTAPFFTAGTGALTATATFTALPVTGTPFPATGHIVLLTFSEAIGVGRGFVPTLSCVGWYESIDLDNSAGTVSYQGEWGMALPKCPDPTPPAVFDMTKLVPYEVAATGAPTTGFTNKWYAIVDDTVAADGCKTGTATCTKPAAGTAMHVLFSHLDSAQTITRVNGQAVDDLKITIQ